MNRTHRSLARLLSLVALASLVACAGGEDQSPTHSEPAASDAAVRDARPDTLAAGAKLDVNAATREELLKIPGVGERMAHEFEEYRPYVSIQQFRKEIGKYVDEAEVARYEQFVFVPVDPDACDAATLQQLPEVDARIAAALIEKRPYASNRAFLDALAGLVPPEAAGRAESYLVER